MNSQGFWEWLTVGAALSAGFGFIAQFMGLRGLAFPCSIAQLGAIFIMALIRAGIRRRLGKVPAHCPALEGYELDFLATQLVFYPEVRTSHRHKKGEEDYGGDMSPSDFCRWEITTPNSSEPDAFFVQSTISQQDSKNGATTPGLEHQESSVPPKKGPSFETASSQQLLRVRERLGDLCHFTSKSSESALSLSRSIEHFLNSFLPLSKKMKEGQNSLSHINWLIEATKLTPTGVSEYPDRVKISVIRNSDGKWEVDIATIDAALSLWMASIEAKKAEKAKNAEEADKAKQAKDAKTTQQRRDAQPGLRKHGSVTDPLGNSGDSSPNWRRTKVGDDLRRSFGRIIGDNFNDEVLKRDISWWVDSIIAEQSDPVAEDDNNSSDGDSDDGSDDGSDAEGNGRLWSRARTSDVDLVIGFNGKKPHNGKHNVS